jgi:hypothetical protein
MNASRMKAEQQEVHLRERGSQDRLYAEWLRMRAFEQSDHNRSDIDADADIDRMAVVEQDIASAVSVLPWQVFRKIEVFRHHLLRFVDDGQDNSTELQILAGIEADLVRFKFGRSKP